MASVRYRFTMSDIDRHGRKRWYVRLVVNGKNVKRRILATEGTERWVAEYRRHLEELQAPKGAKRSPRVKVHSLEWLINQYLASAEFQQAKPATQIQRRSILLRIAKDNGHRDCRTLPRETIEAGRDNRAKTPGAANNMIKVVKSLYVWGIDAGHVTHNPAEGVKRVRMGESTWKPWTEDQRKKFTDRHPFGTTARTAYHLAFDGGLRRSDVVRIGRQHRDATHLRIDQKKTGKRVSILITPDLARALDTAPSPGNGLHYVQTAWGKPFSEKGFGAAVSRWIKDAGLPDSLSIHGLRKADGVRMAESGATENEIAAKLGHSDTRSASIYTKGANQQRLSDAAIRRVMEQSESKSAPPGWSVGQKIPENVVESRPILASGGSGET